MNTEIEWKHSKGRVAVRWFIPSTHSLYPLAFDRVNEDRDFWRAQIGPYTVVIKSDDLAYGVKVFACNDDTGAYALFYERNPYAELFGVDLDDAKARVMAWMWVDMQKATRCIFGGCDTVSDDPMDIPVFCESCGHPMQVVRPGDWQCVNEDCPSKMENKE